LFCDFSSIFRAFKTISRFSGFVFALKINSKKKQILSYPFGSSPQARPAPTRTRFGPAWPAEAHRPAVSMANTALLPPSLGVRAMPGAFSAPIKPRPRAQRVP
jgi:hypothetical protein